MHKKTVLMFIGGAIIVLFIGWFYINQLATPKLFYKEKPGGKSTVMNEQNETSLEEQNVLSKIDSQGDVDVEVTFLPEKSNTETLLFEVLLNTHTGDLLQYEVDELAQISFGSEINKTGRFEWELSNDDSHHTVGLLKWTGEVKSNSNIKLELNNIEKDVSRSFTWDKNEVISSTDMENK